MKKRTLLRKIYKGKNRLTKIEMSLIFLHIRITSNIKKSYKEKEKSHTCRGHALLSKCPSLKK